MKRFLALSLVLLSFSPAWAGPPSPIGGGLYTRVNIENELLTNTILSQQTGILSSISGNTLNTVIESVLNNELTTTGNGFLDRARENIIGVLSGDFFNQISSPLALVNRILDDSGSNNAATGRYNTTVRFTGQTKDTMEAQLYQGSEGVTCGSLLECKQVRAQLSLARNIPANQALVEQATTLAWMSKCSTDPVETLDPELAAACGPEITNVNDTAVLTAYKDCVQEVQAQQPMTQLTDGRVGQTASFSLQLQTTQRNCEAIRLSHEMNRGKTNTKLLAKLVELEASGYARDLETTADAAEWQYINVEANRIESKRATCIYGPPGSCNSAAATAAAPVGIGK